MEYDALEIFSKQENRESKYKFGGTKVLQTWRGEKILCILFEITVFAVWILNRQKQSLQMFFGTSAIKNFTMLEFIFNKTAGLQEISYELSLYFIWEIWIVSLGDTYWLSSAYFILLRVFRFLLFLSFFLIFLWILLLA